MKGLISQAQQPQPKGQRPQAPAQQGRPQQQGPQGPGGQPPQGQQQGPQGQKQGQPQQEVNTQEAYDVATGQMLQFVYSQKGTEAVTGYIEAAGDPEQAWPR